MVGDADPRSGSKVRRDLDLRCKSLSTHHGPVGGSVLTLRPVGRTREIDHPDPSPSRPHPLRSTGPWRVVLRDRRARGSSYVSSTSRPGSPQEEQPAERVCTTFCPGFVYPTESLPAPAPVHDTLGLLKDLEGLGTEGVHLRF